VFSNDFDFGAVWLGWTENLTQPQVKKIKEAKRKAIASLRNALAALVTAAAGDALDGVAALLGFSEDEDDTGSGRIAEALDYLKLRGNDVGKLEFLEPGEGPIELDGVDGVRVYVLGPPQDPIVLKGSEVTEKMKRDGVIYHLTRTGDAGLDALSAALSATPSTSKERSHPFSAEHRIARTNPYFAGVEQFVASTYDDPQQPWRRIDHEWLSAFRQLALDLDNDTNNTSLVLAFEFAQTGEVLLFVGDAQVGNWQSWATLEFKVPGPRSRCPHTISSGAPFSTRLATIAATTPPCEPAASSS
jgi:hypothetical protein